MRLDSPALDAEQSRIPNQTLTEPRFSWWNTKESPGTLLQNKMNTDALQECKIARYTPNQLEIKPISHSLAPKLSRVPQNTVQVAWLPWGNYRDSLRHPRQVYMNIHFSTAARRKYNAPHIVSRWELIPCLWLKRWASFPQAPQVEFSLSNR